MSLTTSPARQHLEMARTFLFVPGSRPDRFEKAVDSGADVVILDLEDAVAPQNKDQARTNVADWLAAGGQAAIRINGIDTPWFEDDLTVLAAATAVVLPKVEELHELELLESLSPDTISVIPLLETPRGVFRAEAIGAHSSVVRMAFGNVDFAARAGVDPGSHVALAHARSQIVYASSAAGCGTPIDGVTTAVRDIDLLRSDAAHARDLGFRAKLLIHPSQVRPVDEVMRPTQDELRWARAVLADASSGVGVVDGHMVDEPVLMRARRLLDEARDTI